MMLFKNYYNLFNIMKSQQEVLINKYTYSKKFNF